MLHCYTTFLYKHTRGNVNFLFSCHIYMSYIYTSLSFLCNSVTRAYFIDSQIDKTKITV